MNCQPLIHTHYTLNLVIFVCVRTLIAPLIKKQKYFLQMCYQRLLIAEIFQDRQSNEIGTIRVGKVRSKDVLDDGMT